MKTIRGLKEHLRRASARFVEDSASTDPAAKARIRELRDELSTEAFFILEKAAQGIGPREMQRLWGGRHENWSRKIRLAFEKAAVFYGLATKEDSPGLAAAALLAEQGLTVDEMGRLIPIGK